MDSGMKLYKSDTLEAVLFAPGGLFQGFIFGQKALELPEEAWIPRAEAAFASVLQITFCNIVLGGPLYRFIVIQVRIDVPERHGVCFGFRTACHAPQEGDHFLPPDGISDSEIPLSEFTDTL